MTLPVIQDCNQCGACCTVGGECIVREWFDKPAEFDERCDLLTDDNRCPGVDATDIVTRYAIWHGQCDFPELRREL